MNNNNNKKYLLIKDGINYRKMAKEMCGLGYQMNHATARSLYLGSSKTFLRNFANELEIDINNEELDKIINSEDTQSILCNVFKKMFVKE